LEPIPKNNTNHKTKNNANTNINTNDKTEAVYTEGLTHPADMIPAAPGCRGNCHCRPAVFGQAEPHTGYAAWQQRFQ
jgi:hypothetical protein